MIGKVFKAYDVRATYPKPLTEKVAWQIGAGAAQYLTEFAAAAGREEPMMKHIVVGHDMRTHSPVLFEALCNGIRDFGAHVIDIGLVDTPMIYFAVNYLGCCGGIQTTASHNPANYNGFKFSKIAAKPVGMGSGLEEVQRFAVIADPNKPRQGGGRIEKRDLWEPYRAHVHQFLDPGLLDGSKTLKVVIDASNGMAGTMVPKVFGDVPGLKITKLNFDNSTGTFVHEPNPLVEGNLKQLQGTVVAKKADLGICFDGDADRCVVIDEHGQTIGCDLLTAWLSEDMLKQSPGSAVVFDLRSSKSVAEMVTEAGGRPVKSRVGHVFMKQAMTDNSAVFGGELSGHFYFRDNFNADSGAIAFAAVVSSLVHSENTMSRQITRAQRYVQSGERNFEVEEKDVAMETLVEAFPDATLEELDGITLDSGDWWCNVRASNTEPLLRLNLEGPDEATVAEKVAEVAGHLADLGHAVDH